MAMRKPVKPDGSVELGVVSWMNGDDFMREYPLLTAHLADTQWEDGSDRATSTILLFTERGCLKACLNDRDSDRSVFVTAKSVEGIFEALEVGLQDNTLDWRAKAGKGRRK